jgi:hypothetical protein
MEIAEGKIRETYGRLRGDDFPEVVSILGSLLLSLDCRGIFIMLGLRVSTSEKQKISLNSIKVLLLCAASRRVIVGELLIEGNE